MELAKHLQRAEWEKIDFFRNPSLRVIIACIMRVNPKVHYYCNFSCKIVYLDLVHSIMELAKHLQRAE